MHFEPDETEPQLRLIRFLRYEKRGIGSRPVAMSYVGRKTLAHSFLLGVKAGII